MVIMTILVRSNMKPVIVENIGQLRKLIEPLVDECPIEVGGDGLITFTYAIDKNGGKIQIDKIERYIKTK